MARAEPTTSPTYSRETPSAAGAISTAAAAARPVTRRPAISPASRIGCRGSNCCSGCCIRREAAPPGSPSKRAAARPSPGRSPTVTSSLSRSPTRRDGIDRGWRARSPSPSTTRSTRTSSNWPGTPMTTCTTCWRISRRFAKALAPIVLVAAVSAQEGGDGWRTYHGDNTGRRHSPLTQITPANVHQITLVWAFATGDTAQIKGTPIVANGIVYVTTPDNVWAIDARSAHQLWRYAYPKNEGFHIGHRGVAIANDSVFFTTPDAHLIALDANTGKVKWNVVVADAKKGYWSTNAPLLIRNHLIVGVAGDFDNLPGMLTSFDPDTGAKQWVFYSTPPPGTDGNPSDGATGGQMWMTGTYDARLNLLFVGTGNPTPVLNGPARAGDNRWTDSIVALNPDTGKLAWGFQATRHDTHDWDAAEVPVLVDAAFNGASTKLLLQASRNGYFYVLDRTTGRSLLTKEFATANWAKGIDQDG